VKGGGRHAEIICAPGVTDPSRNSLGDHIPGIAETGIEASGAPERAGDAHGHLVGLTRAADLPGSRTAVALREGRRTGEGRTPEPGMGTAS